MNQTHIFRFLKIRNRAVQSVLALVHFILSILGAFPSLQILLHVIVALQLVLDHVHAERPDFVLHDHGMEVRVGGETEERVDDVGAEVETFAPVFAENPRQSAEHCFVLLKFFEVVGVTGELKNVSGSPDPLRKLLVQQLNIFVNVSDRRAVRLVGSVYSARLRLGSSNSCRLQA